MPATRRASASTVVDADVLRAKTERVLHHVGRLRRRGPLSGEHLRADEDLLSIVTMDLQQAVQACIDLAVHACADDDLGVPTGPGDAFSKLAQAGFFGTDLATRLAGAAGLRNLIVHRYGALDCGRIASVIRDDLVDLEAFAAALHEHQ